MMLSLSTASFAGSSEVEIDKEYTMTVDTDKTFLLNIPEDGVYKLSAAIDNSTGDFNMAAISVEINEENVSNLFLCYFNTEEVVDFPVASDILSDEDYFVAGKGENVTVELDNYQDSFDVELPAPTVTFSITKVDNLPEIRMNGSYSFTGESAYFILKPTEDGIYNLNSTLPCDDVSVMDSDGNIYYSYFDSESSLDFSFIVEAGKLYCIYLACFDEDIAEFSFNVTDAIFMLSAAIWIGTIPLSVRMAHAITLMSLRFRSATRRLQRQSMTTRTAQSLFTATDRAKQLSPLPSLFRAFQPRLKSE